MLLEEAKRMLADVRTRFDGAFSPADKDTIARLYAAVLGRPFRATSCQRCYHDAVIEVTLYLKRHNRMAQEKNYIMRNGFIIACPTFHDGKIYTNENLTDEIAAEYLERFPDRAKFFAKIPEKPVSASTTPANAAEVDSTTPKRKRVRKTKK